MMPGWDGYKKKQLLWIIAALGNRCGHLAEGVHFFLCAFSSSSLMYHTLMPSD